MAFQSGSASDVFELLDQIRQFALSLGWTVNRWVNNNELSLELSGQHWHLRAVSNMGSIASQWTGGGIWMTLSIDYSGTADWDAHPGDMGSNTLPLGEFLLHDTVPQYWLFGGSNYLHIVGRLEAGWYSHLHLGELEKVGTWTGGQYGASTARNREGSFSRAFASFTRGNRNPTAIRADIDGETDNWVRDVGELYSVTGWTTSEGGFLGQLLSAAPGDWDLRAQLWPCYTILPRPNGRRSLAGYPPDVRVLNIKALQPEQEIAIGSDTWLVFPWHNKPDASGYAGFAYRKVDV